MHTSLNAVAVPGNVRRGNAVRVADQHGRVAIVHQNRATRYFYYWQLCQRHTHTY